MFSYVVNSSVFVCRLLGVSIFCEVCIYWLKNKQHGTPNGLAEDIREVINDDVRQMMEKMNTKKQLLKQLDAVKTKEVDSAFCLILQLNHIVVDRKCTVAFKYVTKSYSLVRFF